MDRVLSGRLLEALAELDAALDLRRATLTHVTEAKRLVNEALGLLARSQEGPETLIRNAATEEEDDLGDDFGDDGLND